MTTSRWTKDLATDVDFYDVDITYDRNSNITLTEDNVHAGFDVDYTIDNVNRLTDAEEGTWGGSSITTTSRQQEWTLDQVGNWDVAKLDLNGDGDWGDANEYNGAATHAEARLSDPLRPFLLIILAGAITTIWRHLNAERGSTG